MAEDNDFEGAEIISTDSPDFFTKDKTFNHEVLVMRAYTRVQDTLAQEMVEGHNSSITDSNGKPVIIYHKDTRHEAIEAIQTLKNTMIADITGTEYENNINVLYNQMEAKFKTLLENQTEWYYSLGYDQQKHIDASYSDLQFAMSFNKLYPDLPFGQDWINFRIKIYREIFEQLELCLAKTKYFKKGRIGG